MNQQNQLQTTIPLSLVSYGNKIMLVIRYVEGWTGLTFEKAEELVKTVPVKFEISIASNKRIAFLDILEELHKQRIEIYLDEDLKLSTLELKNRIDEVNDETTLVERLRQIFQSYFYLNPDSNREKILKAMASNPNTPLELLEILGIYYPEQFLDNPAFDLYLFANPNFLAEIPKQTLISLLDTDRVPKSLISLILNNSQNTNTYMLILNSHHDIWNQWRKDNPKVKINLKNARLMGANLENVNLENADLRSADLKEANLKNTNLLNADLRNANLSGAKLDDNSKIYSKWRLVCEIVSNEQSNLNLAGADLEDANLSYAYLKGANLKGANLESANLENADLSFAHLEGANLKDADLFIAYLRNTNLSGANLENADLTDANLTGADLRQIKVNSQTKIDSQWLNQK